MTFEVFKSTRLAPHWKRRGVKALYFIQSSTGEIVGSFTSESDAKAKVRALQEETERA